MVNQGTQAVITGNVGPSAFNVLASAGLQVHLTQAGTFRQALEALKAGQLQSLLAPSARMHASMGMAMARSMGRGMGIDRGMEQGMGRWAGYGAGAPSAVPLSPAPGLRQAGLEGLRADVKVVQEQLAQVLDHIDKLEKKG